MGKTLKIAAGLGILAGISYFGRNRIDTARISAKAGGIVGYLKGLDQGLMTGIKAMFRRPASSI